MLRTVSAAEASLVPAAQFFVAASLLAVCEHLAGRAVMLPTPATIAATPDDVLDLADVRGQGYAKRVLEIAAAGGHSLLII